jgi:hypothetical protein
VGIGRRSTPVAVTTNQNDTAARRLASPSVRIPRHDVLLDLRLRPVAGLYPVLRNITHGALANHSVLLNVGRGQRPIHDNAAFLIIPDRVAVDVSFGVAVKREVNSHPVLSTVERRFTDIRDE